MNNLRTQMIHFDKVCKYIELVCIADLILLRCLNRNIVFELVKL